jgi:hypothetical protein
MPDFAFIWPADHAWCVANDVDPHWAGIGADVSAVSELLADPRLDVVAATQARTSRMTGRQMKAQRVPLANRGSRPGCRRRLLGSAQPCYRSQLPNVRF